ncbi:MAG: hypothetical protein FWH12_04710 [Treponema sp.]|nr:hypothetical protein [Treponema sp.]
MESNRLIYERLERRYRRLCRVQKELEDLDLSQAREDKKTLEAYVHSRIDFSRYRRIPLEDFEDFYLPGLQDFEDPYLVSAFALDRRELSSLITKSYTRTEPWYLLTIESNLVLSVMRTLDCSLDWEPLVDKTEKETLGPYLHDLDFTHSDGAITTLNLSDHGELVAHFRPKGKSWTVVVG